MRIRDIQKRSEYLCHFYLGMELKLGAFVFLQNNHGLSGVYDCQCIYCGLQREDKDAQNAAQHVMIMGAFDLHLFLCMWSEDPQFEPYG